jgi:hypothetical protein
MRIPGDQKGYFLLKPFIKNVQPRPARRRLGSQYAQSNVRRFYSRSHGGFMSLPFVISGE